MPRAMPARVQAAELWPSVSCAGRLGRGPRVHALGAQGPAELCERDRVEIPISTMAVPAMSKMTSASPGMGTLCDSPGLRTSRDHVVTERTRR